MDKWGVRLHWGEPHQTSTGAGMRLFQLRPHLRLRHPERRSSEENHEGMRLRDPPRRPAKHHLLREKH